MATLLTDFGVSEPKVSIGMDASAAIGMAQRTGLNKVRHVEVDVLWLQEQQARRLLPITKIPGPQNPSDLCTKNVPIGLLEQYLKQLNVYFAEGRAAVAQQLHALREKSLVRASLEVGDPSAGLSRVIGGQEEPQVCAALVVGDPDAGLTRVIGGLGLERESAKGPTRSGEPMRLKKVKTKSAVERGVDSWLVDGVDGEWRRAHRTPRRASLAGRGRKIRAS